MDPDKMPCEYCASGHALPYGRFGVRHSLLRWRKVGRGLIAVTDDSAKKYVVPGLVIGVEISDDSVPEICTYWRKTANGKQKMLYERPYSLNTIRRLVAKKQMARRDVINYDELVRRVRSVYQNCWIPPRDMLMMEYGLAATDSEQL